jgi:phosphatidylglycerophosphate synthase
LDGCDGEIARAKYLESERGRQLDDLFDVMSNILLVIGLGSGLFAEAKSPGYFGWIYLIEGVLSGILIAVNEFSLASDATNLTSATSETLDRVLYPRHRELVQRSGLLFFGEKFAYWLIQLTKRDVAILFFVFLAVIGLPALILHLQFLVTAISFVLALRSRTTTPAT